MQQAVLELEMLSIMHKEEVFATQRLVIYAELLAIFEGINF